MAVFGQRLRQTPHNIQCLYDLDRRVYCVKNYPILSPQGASIIIYGHENGISIVWRGGCRLVDAKKPDPKPAPKSDSVMILDSDEEGAPSAAASSAAFEDKPVFENAPSYASDGGFAEVVQTLDLAMNQAVLSIAVLPLASCLAKDAEPALLQDTMVFAITCRATADVFVVTLPLTPPSNESMARPQLRQSLLAGNLGRGAFGDTLVALGGSTRRSDGVAIALAKHKAAAAAAAGSAPRPSAVAAASPTRVIVAAHSREASGTIRLWDVTVGVKRPASDRPIEPFQTEYLPSPLSAIAFNPTHPTQLLAVDPQRAVRIYDYSLPAIPSDDTTEGPFPPQGSWLLSLYAPFVRPSGTMTATVRKPVIAAAWIAQGHAILALLADGHWGIWDIDRPSPSSRTGGLFGGSGGAGLAASGVRGAALTAFSISGQIEGTSPLRNPVTGSRKSTDGDFVPMTPHTRRDALAATFAGSNAVERLALTPGGIEVAQQRSLRDSVPGKETAVLWLGGADYIVSVIPDVTRFWDSQLRRSSAGGSGGSGGGSGVGLFTGTRPTRMLRVQDLNASLQGERCCGAVVTTHLGSDDIDDADDAEHASADKVAAVEILVLGESRLVVVRANSDNVTATNASSLTTRLLAASARKRHPGDTVTSAILVEPSRARKRGTVKFDLDALQQEQDNLRLRSGGGEAVAAVMAGGSAPGRRQPLTKSLFDSPAGVRQAPSYASMTPQRGQSTARSLFDENEVTLTQSMMRPPRSARPALPFAGDLDDAANASDDEEAVEDRNVEEEMLDIMEIDRELEAMRGRRDAGAPSVFFENA